ncbi:MAG: DUF6922 domain-containing protein [Myxococcota bacterium]
MRELHFKEFLNKKYLFWDIEPEKVDLERHKKFIIARSLRFGLVEDIKFVFNHFSIAEIINVVKTSRSLDRKTANFWALYFGIKKEDIYCLREQFQQSCFY